MVDRGQPEESVLLPLHRHSLNLRDLGILQLSYELNPQLVDILTVESCPDINRLCLPRDLALSQSYCFAFLRSTRILWSRISFCGAN